MTLVLSRETKGPATHALIVASGEIPRYPAEGSTAPLTAVRGLADWLIEHFRNDTAPLASVDILASAASGRIDYARSQELHVLEPPRFDTLDAALHAWRRRLDSDPANIAFFYYAGYVLRLGETLLTMQDFADYGEPGEGGPISFASVITFMRGCQADRQLYIVDGLALHFGSATEKMLPRGFAQPPSLRSPRCVVIEGESPKDAVGPATPLAPALVRIFEAARGTPVSARDIAGRLPKLLEPRTRLVRVNVAGDFDFHYPAAAAERPAEPGEAGPEVGRDDAEARHDELGTAKLEQILARLSTSGQDAPIALLRSLAEAFGEVRPGAGGSELEDHLRAKIGEYHQLRERIAAVQPGDNPDVALRIAADRAIAAGDFERADRLLAEAEMSLDTRVGELLDRKAERRAMREEAAAMRAREAGQKQAPSLPPPDPEEANTEFVLDDAEAERDALGRSVLAIGLARRLHKIWRQTNESAPAAGESRAAFVVHLDAPWGGGKTSFANFLARVLNPCPPGRPAAAFLAERYPGVDLGGVFLDDPPPDAAAAEALAKLPADARRPWLVVTFNAWQAEHCAPPWWVFYQAIRKDCFKAIRAEGDSAWTPHAPQAGSRRRAALAARWRGWRAALQGKGRWLFLAGREYLWRFGNPRILSVILLAAIGSILLVILWWLDVLDWEQLKTWVPILSGALAGLWGLAAFFTESIAPGTATVAERLSLGAGDPFSRFRTHFARMMERVRRPVMVVIDDLDRCRPDFVVDLVRGIQTLLRSPRVVFLILGDRDWIERAFETHHATMKEIDVGPEQSFGARFVEKAIQLSFILPALHEDGRRDYVRRVLLGERAGPRAGPAQAAGATPDPTPETAAAADPDTADTADMTEPADAPSAASEPPKSGAEDLGEAAIWAAATVREIVNREVAGRGVDPFDAAAIVKQVCEELAHRWLMDDIDYPAGASESFRLEALHQWLALIAGGGPLEQIVGETLAIRAASDERVEREVTHELQRLAAGFPANPRQIKRIVNAITIYYSVALQRPGITADAKFRGQLALWIVIMTEWPRTWRLLASFPGLADRLAGKAPGKARSLPGSANAIAQALARIRADRQLTELITGVDRNGERTHDRLEGAAVAILAELTPLHSRRHRLEEEAGSTSRKPQPRRKPKAAGSSPSRR